MPQIVNLTPTTELEAVNAMLSAIGEAPIEDVDTATQADVEMALNILRMTTREVQSRGWRFNKEYNYALASTGSYSGGTLFTFTPPSDVISYTLSRTTTQRGLDIITRKNRVVIGANAVGTISVIADRLLGADGWSFSTMYLDVVSYVDFESMPDTARRHITALAAQRFAVQSDAIEVSDKLVPEVQMTFEALQADQSETVLSATQDPSTELGAVNRCLIVNGFNPTFSLTQLTSKEAVTALDLVRSVTREMLFEGWNFNTELGLTIEPAGVQDDYNVFTPPERLLKWELTKTVEQATLDVGLQVSKLYQEGGENVLVFYDRINNMDGVDADELLIDVVWDVDYDDLPDTAKQYVSIRAARLLAKTMGNKAVILTDGDERLAFRALKRDQGNDEDINIFNNPDTLRVFGSRPRLYGVMHWGPTGRRTT